jgi:hypothetical protein
MSHDDGSIVLGWLTKIALGLAIVGLLLFEAVSVGLAHMGAQDDARGAASAASDVWQSTHKAELAYQAALSYADEHGDVLSPDDFEALPDGTVSVRITKVATTLVLRHVKPLRSWTQADSSARVKSVSS